LVFKDKENKDYVGMQAGIYAGLLYETPSLSGKLSFLPNRLPA